MANTSIMFDPSLVPGVVAGTITRTRRLADVDRKGWITRRGWSHNVKADRFCVWSRGGHPVDVTSDLLFDLLCPYGPRESRLWLRECHARVPDQRGPVHYLADGPAPDPAMRSYTSRFMPRWAARCELVITGGRLCPLHDVREEELAREGFASVHELELHWDKIHGRGAWGEPCWAWVVDWTLSRLTLTAE